MNKKEQEVANKAYQARLKALEAGNIVIWPHSKPIAMEYQNGDVFEMVTEPDVSPSLAQMVKTGNVIPAGSSRFYEFDDLPENDVEAHAMPDASLLRRMDVTQQDEMVDEFISNPENYEKPEQEEEQEVQPDKDGGLEKDKSTGKGKDEKGEAKGAKDSKKES